MILRLLIRRFLEAIPVLFVIYSVTFLLFQLTPGSPFQAEGRQAIPPRALEKIEEHYGLDNPWYEQYARYGWNALRGDFGPSYYQPGRDTAEIIGDALPITLQLAALAFALAFVFGLSLGVLSAVKQNTALDYFVTATAIAGISVPSYVMASFLVAILAVGVSLGGTTIGGQLLPTGGWDGLLSTRVIIPVIALASYPTGELARFTRASMLEVINQDYVRTARAKGLRETAVVRRHILRNALIPVITVAGFEASFLIAGSFFVEAITNVPGMGRVAVTALVQRDHPLIMATVLLFAVVVLVVNLLVDVLYLFLDPRIRYR